MNICTCRVLSIRTIAVIPSALALLLLLLAVGPHVPAMAQGTASPRAFVVAYDYTAFAYNDTLSRVEFAVSFSDRALTYRKDKSGAMMGKLYTRLVFSDIRGGDPSEVEWVTAVAEPGPDAPEQPMVGIRNVALAPGMYRAQIYFIDVAADSRRDSISFELRVPSFVSRTIQLSDIELVSEAFPSEDAASIFYKNGYTVMPNVSGIAGPPFYVLDTYIEIYNADKVPTTEYQLVYRLADEQKRVFHEEPPVSLQRPGPGPVVHLHSFQIDSLQSGTYYVIVKAFNGLARFAMDSALVARKVRVVNPFMDSLTAARSKSVIQNVLNTVDPLYAGLKENELDDEFGKVKAIASEQEIALWEGIRGADAKARYITNFWAARDATPGTPDNESREEYYKRVEEARNLYASPMSPKGWDSDRGRVLLKYGRPDNIDRHFQDFNRKPYEIWTYSGMNYEFVFVDRTQTGFYKLVHSTAPNEARYENWERDFTPLNKNWKDN